MAEYDEDYYRILGLPPDAGQADIRAAWRRLISYWHPDRTNHKAAEARSKELNRAYQVLSNEETRADYDRWYQGQERVATEETRSDYDRWPRSRRGTARQTDDGSEHANRSNGSGPESAEPTPGARPSWQPPPLSYSHHPGVDPITGLPLIAGGSPQTLGYLLWTAGFAAWLMLLGITTRIGGAMPSPALVTVIFVIDVMCLWTWLFAIAAVFRRKRRHWGRFWGAELLGALTASSATLLVAAIGIAAAVLLTPSGLNAFRQRAWVGVALAVLALSGVLGVLTFRYFLQRWGELDQPPRHATQRTEAS